MCVRDAPECPLISSMNVHLYCTNSWSKLVLAAIPPTLLCPGHSSLRVHSRWESHRTPALLLRNRGWVWRQWRHPHHLTALLRRGGRQMLTLTCTRSCNCSECYDCCNSVYGVVCGNKECHSFVKISPFLSIIIINKKKVSTWKLNSFPPGNAVEITEMSQKTKLPPNSIFWGS